MYLANPCYLVLRVHIRRRKFSDKATAAHLCYTSILFRSLGGIHCAILWCGNWLSDVSGHLSFALNMERGRGD